jgi:hypothetical protein
MAGSPSRTAKSYSIEELAIKHHLTHHNDKSGGVKARMHRTFGRSATKAALESVADTLKMCDPNFTPKK